MSDDKTPEDGQREAAPALKRSTRMMARSLGWFSIGLGVAELVMPRLMARATGLQGRETLVRAYGVREIATGVGLLTARDPAPWMWARVAGDALDAATLGYRARRGLSINSMLSIAAVAGVAIVDAMAAKSAHADAQRMQQPPRDYSDRVGMPKPPDEMRGAALEDFDTPEDMLAPKPMRSYNLH